MQYFYTCLTAPLQNEIAKDFAISYKRDYGTNIQITSEMLENVLKTATFFRNVCAHEERLYNFKIHKPAKSRSISRAISIPQIKLENGDVFAIFTFLKLALPKKEHKTLIRKVKNLFSNYSSDFTSANFIDILTTMGFDPQWESYFN